MTKATHPNPLKRLFIFATYSADNCIDDVRLHYIRSLAELGNVIVVMDCDADDSQIARIKSIPNVLYATATRHGEYDFGSYKRGFQYARAHNLISKYDWIYFANDSTYGPFYGLERALTDLESRDTDFTGMADFHRDDFPPHVQSWFFGFSRELATQQFIGDFFDSITTEPRKARIIYKYESRMSRIILLHGYEYSVIMQHSSEKHTVYDSPTIALGAGVPFLKRAGDAIGNLGDVDTLYQHGEPAFVDSVINDIANRGLSADGTTFKMVFRFSLFKIPLIQIQRRYKKNNHNTYKVFLFDSIQIMKIMLRP